MSKIEFESSLYLASKSKMLVKVIKTGSEAVTARVSFTGSSNSTKERYLDRAHKSTEGLFNAANEYLVWEEGETGTKSVIVDVYKNATDHPRYFYCSLKGTGDNLTVGLNKCHCFVMPIAPLSGYVPKTYVEPGIAKVGEMQLVFSDDKGRVYPEELHPVLNPTVNVITYFEVGDLLIANAQLLIPVIEQYTQTKLDEYNAANGTDYTNKTKEHIIMPFTNGSMASKAQFQSSNLWTKVDGSSTIDWLHPLSATMLPNSNVLEIEYKNGRWATPFNEKQEYTWSVELMITLFLNKGEINWSLGNTEAVEDKEKLMDDLTEKSKGLYWMSESDYPFTAFKWDVAQLDNESVLALTSHSEGTAISTITLDEMMSNAVTINDPNNQTEVETATKYIELVSFIKDKLSDVIVYRVGEVEVDVYIVGRNDVNGYVGLSTVSVET